MAECGAELVRADASHDGPHVCDGPVGHPHMRCHGCRCGYTWPALPIPADRGPAYDPEALKREISRLKTHFHRRCDHLSDLLADARSELALTEAHRDEAVAVIGELIDWFGAPDWTGPIISADLAKRIADLMPAREDTWQLGEHVDREETHEPS